MHFRHFKKIFIALIVTAAVLLITLFALGDQVRESRQQMQSSPQGNMAPD